ncbi:MAG: hypothetical protein AAFV80_05090, partial [Bacteroidota bacterium]
NKDIAENVKARDLNLIKYTKKLIFHVHHPEQLEKMHQEIIDNPQVKLKTWLLAKLEHKVAR